MTSQPIKYTLLLLLTLSTAFAQEKSKDTKDKEAWDKLNKPTPHIIDPEDIFTPDQERFLEDAITDYQKHKGVEFIIISESNADKFKALNLKEQRKWESEKAEDNAVLLAISKDLHRMRIQNGNKIKEKVSDAETRLIIDAFCVPKFKNNDYYQGALDGMTEIINKMK